MPAKKSRPKKPGTGRIRKAGKKRSSSQKAITKRAALKRKSKRKRLQGRANAGVLVAVEPRGLGARGAGQSGDTQGLSGIAEVDSESVEELLEEGQSYEAEVLDGVQKALDPDEAEVFTREVPEDDVPEEYRGTSERD